MKTFGNLLEIAIIAIVSITIAGVFADKTETLALPGSSLAAISPVLALASLLASKALNRHRFVSSILLALTIVFVLYPGLLYRAFGKRFEYADQLPPESKEQFQTRFGVPVIFESGTRTAVVVSRFDHSSEMNGFLSSLHHSH